MRPHKKMGLLLGLLVTVPASAATLTIVNNETFDSIGTSATATLPTGWKADKSTSVRTVGSYSSAGTATENRGGNSMGSTNGIYNFGAGVSSSATDRAVGFLSSGTATESGNLYFDYGGIGTSDLLSLNISYDVEKYRMGTNSAGFSIQLYYSTDGSAWTSAGSAFLTNFAADASSVGYASAPGDTQSISGQTLTFSTPIAASSNLFLAWNYSVSSGSTTTNAQALGIDNVNISGTTPGANSVPLPASLSMGLGALGLLLFTRCRKQHLAQPH